MQLSTTCKGVKQTPKNHYFNEFHVGTSLWKVDVWISDSLFGKT
jgi:hypothetical protein